MLSFVNQPQFGAVFLFEMTRYQYGHMTVMCNHLLSDLGQCRYWTGVMCVTDHGAAAGLCIRLDETPSTSED